jgi:hypothetical protein
LNRDDRVVRELDAVGYVRDYNAIDLKDTLQPDSLSNHK